MQFRVIDASLAEVECRTRTPFRFGAVTVAAAPLLHLRLTVESVDGRRARGMAADLLVPRWFRKDLPPGADTSTPAAALPALDQAELRASAVAAARTARADLRHRTVFALWRELHDAHVTNTPPTANRLAAGFGVALVERALVDAACRLVRSSFWSALCRDLFGVRLDAIHADLPQRPLADWLPAAPRTRFLLRHTVGMLDPLDDGAGAGADDGEPVSVAGYLRRDALRWLKVKIGQGHAADRDRLIALARLCRRHGADVAFTLDGNEQFGALAELAELLDAVAADADGRELLRRTAHIEQPLPRAATFDATANAGAARVLRFAPLALDEADAEPAAFPRALALGWRGVSAKNCKGLFRALANRALALHRGDGAFVCGEDLTNLPLLSLQQDLATMGALDIPHVERNGHHYFPGLDHLPAGVAAAALAAHGDLYRGTDAGRVRLRIADGALDCASLLGPGYACDAEPFAALAAGLAWQPVD